MLGQIKSYDERCQTGVVRLLNQDHFYEFHIDQWNCQSQPKAGDSVDFELEDEIVIDIGPVGAYLTDLQAKKGRIVAGLLGVILGFLGAHRFYLGFWGMGVAQILVTVVTAGYGVVWGFLEGVLILTGHINKDAKGRPLK